MIRVGVLTFWGAVNYGAYLQAYALVNRLNQEPDFHAELIQYRMGKEIDHYRQFLKPEKNFIKWIYRCKRDRMFRQQRKILPLSEPPVISNSIADFEDAVYGKYDVIVAGSDEIWKVDGMRGYPTPYFLFGNLSAHKVSYAASGRVGFDSLNTDELAKLKETFSEFEYIGVRDTATYESINQLLENSDTLRYNLDPTFIFDFKPNANHGKEILHKRFHIDTKKFCIGVMYLEDKPTRPVIRDYIRETMAEDVQIVALYEWFGGSPSVPDLTPLEWVDVIAALDGLISMYFHGICFSIIAGTPFYAIESRAHHNDESKIYDLLHRFNMTEFYSLGLKEAMESGRLLQFIKECGNHPDTKACQTTIEQGRKEFSNFIEHIRRICNDTE